MIDKRANALHLPSSGSSPRAEISSLKTDIPHDLVALASPSAGRWSGF
jgi:hypothetical protein